MTVSGPFAETIAGANLVETTLQLIARQAPDLQLGAVHLEKNLPIAAGIGGGSADAAAVIRAVQKANPHRAGGIDWNRIALHIGADVPVCLVSRLAWMRGVGVIVDAVPVKHSAQLFAVIANPCAAVPPDKTARVFRALHAPALDPGFQAEIIGDAFAGGAPLFDLIAAGRNALEEAAVAVVPAARDVLAALGTLSDARLARMSGGGPTCFALFRDGARAGAAAAKLSSEHPNWWVCATTLS